MSLGTKIWKKFSADIFVKSGSIYITAAIPNTILYSNTWGQDVTVATCNSTEVKPRHSRQCMTDLGRRSIHHNCSGIRYSLANANTNKLQIGSATFKPKLVDRRSQFSFPFPSLPSPFPFPFHLPPRAFNMPLKRGLGILSPGNFL